MTRWIHKRKSDRERGQSIIEFALLAPVLILLFMGMFDFGWILHQQIQMDNGARLGARRGAVGASNQDIMDRIIDTCSFPVTQDQITIDVRDSNGNSVGDNTDRTPDNVIYVAVSKEDVQLVTPLAGLMSSMGPIDLLAEAEFLIE